MTRIEKDGSGLLVKRVRGRTLPQWISPGYLPARTSAEVRKAARWGGRLCAPTDVAAKVRTMRRRAKAKRKAAREKRRGRWVLCQPWAFTGKIPRRTRRVISRLTYDRAVITTPGGTFHWPPEKRQAVELGGCWILHFDSPGGPWSEARQVFEEAQRKVDAELARLLGEERKG